MRGPIQSTCHALRHGGVERIGSGNIWRRDVSVRGTMLPVRWSVSQPRSCVCTESRSTLASHVFWARIRHS